jgi:hypothetical protein
MYGYGYGGMEFLLMPLALVGLVVLAVVALAGTRGDPDPHGHRPRTLYLCLVTFVALFTLVYAAATAVSAVANLALVDLGDSGRLSEICEMDPLHPECRGGGVTQFVNVFGEASPEAQEAARARDALNGLALGLAAAAVLIWHRRRWAETLGDETFLSSPGARTYDAYLHAASFTAMIVLLAAAAAALFALARVVVPGVVSDGGSGAERDAGLVQLVTSLAAGGAAGAVYLSHWRRIRPLRTPPAE